MKRITQLTLAAACTAMVSFSSVAGYPGDGDCNSWKRLLDRCETGAPGGYYGMTCAEIYYTWKDCQGDAYNNTPIAPGRENTLAQ